MAQQGSAEFGRLYSFVVPTANEWLDLPTPSAQMGRARLTAWVRAAAGTKFRLQERVGGGSDPSAIGALVGNSVNLNDAMTLAFTYSRPWMPLVEFSADAPSVLYILWEPAGQITEQVLGDRIT